MQRFAWLLVPLGWAIFAASAAAAEPEVQTLLEGLHSPAGVAVQPETGHVFVADSGALRVVRLVDGKAQDVIAGFTSERKDGGGPLGLAFLDKDLLAIGTGGYPAGKDELLIFAVPKVGDPAVPAEKSKLSLNLPAAGDMSAEGHFTSVAAMKNSILATTRGDVAKGWIAKAEVRGTKVEDFRRFIATKTSESTGLPGAITISPRGDLIVGRMSDGLLSFYSVKDGLHLATFTTGLKDISGLAYSPQGQLYALNFAPADVEGGLYQIIAQGNATEVHAKKIIAIERPSAMAFAADGGLYITVFGPLKETGKATGSLVQIQAGF